MNCKCCDKVLSGQQKKFCSIECTGRFNTKIIVSKEELEKLYITENLSTTTIAKRFNCSGSLISLLLRKYNLNIGQLNKYTREQHPSWSGYGEISGAYWNGIKQGAKSRKIEFSITKEYLWNLFIKQDKKCALTGLPLYFNEVKTNRGNKTASLDRIDSSKGYIEGNVQWVHKDVNEMKWDSTQQEFVNFCCLVAKYSGFCK